MRKKIQRLQRMIADRLNRSCREWSSARIVMLFGIVLLVVFIASTVVIHNAIFRKSSSPVVRITRITAKPLLPARHLTDTIVTESLYYRLQAFRLFLDSIPVPERDSLLAGRPGMLDSVNFLESVYNNQKRIIQ